MNVLYICYWGVEEGLTASSVFPHLKILADNPKINKIFFSTIERGGKLVKYSGPISDKIVYTPLYSKNFKPSVINKVFDFIFFPRKLKEICDKNKIDKIIGRGAPAGAIASKISRSTGIPYVVESFEPHADYMYESGIWSKSNPKYIFEQRWEKEVKKSAEYLIPVSENYKKRLIREDKISEDKIIVVPCCVDFEKFKFDIAVREKVRNKLAIPTDAIVGIYVGKFGGIYFTNEAFSIFNSCNKVFQDKFFLIVLSPDNKNNILEKLKTSNFPLEKVYVEKALHSDVPKFLSAADFAFSLQTPKPSNLYLSPIKNGEYWANGLPILVTEGVGDDTDIIEKEKKGGATFNFNKNNVEEALKNLSIQIGSTNRNKLSEEVSVLAKKYRNFDIVRSAYNKVLNL